MIFEITHKPLAKVLHDLAEQKSGQILQGHMMLDHIHR